MVRLNRNVLSSEQHTQLFAQLERVLERTNGKGAAQSVLTLLGPEEQIMLVKRLAIILLLREGTSLYRIAHLLKVSATTAEKIKRNLEAGQYDPIIAILKRNRREFTALLDTLDSILHVNGLLPHYNGKDRYDFLK